jgi:DNA-3-methyladenine glycosylase
MAQPLDREWFLRDAPEVAPQLLGKLLTVTTDGVVCSGRITEVEAYMPDDPASHTFSGETVRNSVMFRPGGHLYVYLSYGIHQCANVVTGEQGSGQAVLIRAVEPIDGIAVMRSRRGRRSDSELANGPGKVCQALAILADYNGADLVDGPVTVADDGTPPPESPLVGQRIGIAKGAETPWRFRIASRRSNTLDG